MQNRVGEVIEASTTEFVAQCYELYQSPPFGSLVKTTDGNTESYGIVYNVTTTSIEPGRRPLARGKDEASEAEIYKANPQLTKLLKSEFNGLVTGYRQGDNIYHYLPQNPCRIHCFVYQCTPEEVLAFSRSLDFLSMLVNAQLEIPAAELVSAALRQMGKVQTDPRTFLVGAGKELTTLLGKDFNRLKAILGRIKQ